MRGITVATLKGIGASQPWGRRSERFHGVLMGLAEDIVGKINVV